MKFCVNCLKLEAEDEEDLNRLKDRGFISDLEYIMAQIQLKEEQGEEDGKRQHDKPDPAV